MESNRRHADFQKRGNTRPESLLHTRVLRIKRTFTQNLPSSDRNNRRLPPPHPPNHPPARRDRWRCLAQLEAQSTGIDDSCEEPPALTSVRNTAIAKDGRSNSWIVKLARSRSRLALIRGLSNVLQLLAKDRA